MTAATQRPIKRRLAPGATGPRAPRLARPPRIRILVADGYAIDRRAMVSLLRGQQDFEVVGEAAAVAEVIERWRDLAPQVLVLSQSTPFDGGETAVATLRAALPGARILAVADRSAADCVVLNPPSRRRLEAVSQVRSCAAGTDCLQLAFNDGAMGVLRRSATPDELFRAVRALAAGSPWLEPGTAAQLATGSLAADSRQALELSARELDVAALIAEGYSNKEISTSLRISEPTVKKYVGRVLDKLRVEDRLQAGLFLSRHPLLLRRRAAVAR
jgi:NarL family two-component system response regulator LiaR